MTLDHENVLLSTGARSGLPNVVALHSTTLGQAVGGCRMWRYDDWSAALQDALRLSSAMTMKCALAGLPLGGGKSVIALTPDTVLTPALRTAVLHDLGDLIDSLDGSYGVGEDVGTTADDMTVIAERTPHVYGRPASAGGSGEPSAPTALGVYESLVAACERVFGTADLSGRTVTVLGLGQVGHRLAERLAADGAKLTVTDIDPAKQALAAALGADWVPVETAATAPADVLVPAALGGLLTRELVPQLRCAAVVGPANNQLASDDVADLLAEHDVLWAPDYLVNAGVVVAGFHLELGSKDPAVAEAAVTAIGTTLREVLDRAEAEGTTPSAAARAVALDRLTAASMTA
jgi:leucine dehydrogenase